MNVASTVPEGFTLIPLPDRSNVVREVWRSWDLLITGLFVALWDGSLIFVYWALLFHSERINWFAVFFPTLHVALGVALAYEFLARLCNHRYIIVSPVRVQVVIGPIPYPGNKTAVLDEVWKVLVRERVSKRTVTYEVTYMNHSKREHTLVSSIEHLDQAEFIAALIQQALPVDRTDYPDV